MNYTQQDRKDGTPIPEDETFIVTLPDGGENAEVRLDPGTCLPIFLQIDTWMSLKDLKELRKFLKAAEAQLKAAA